MTLGPPHPFRMQWDVHFYRDTSRLQRLAKGAKCFERIRDARELAEHYICALHAYFYNAIREIEWHDGVFVLRIRMPRDRSCNIALGSYGTGHYVIRGPQGYDDVFCPDGVVLVNVLIRDLGEYGLNVRPDMSRRPRQPFTPEPARTSSGSSIRVKLEKKEEKSATVLRMKAKHLDEVDEHAIDRANAETATSDDDARIIRFKSDGGPGNTVVLHGVRAGLSGTTRQRNNVDCVSIKVKTMHPEAKVSIDPPDCAPDVPGHQVRLPDGEDTTITVTATAVDGLTTSTFRYIAQRSCVDDGD